MKTLKYTLVAKQSPDGTVAAGEVNCWLFSCPAVLKTTTGKAIVVGRILSKKEQEAITKTGAVAFHDGEVAVEVSPELLRIAVRSL